MRQERLGWRLLTLLPWFLPLMAAALLAFASPGDAAPGLCVGPVCADDFIRSQRYPWQLRMRVQDQAGHRERLVVDCRDGSISPQVGPVERGYAEALSRRACRLAPLSSLPPTASSGSSPPEARG